VSVVPVVVIILNCQQENVIQIPARAYILFRNFCTACAHISNSALMSAPTVHCHWED